MQMLITELNVDIASAIMSNFVRSLSHTEVVFPDYDAFAEAESRMLARQKLLH
jgi:hypothetical protein